MAGGITPRVMAGSGIRTCNPAGRPISKAVGSGSSRGAGPGSTPRPGGSHRPITVAGRSSAIAGAGSRAVSSRRRYMHRRSSAFSAGRGSGYTSPGRSGRRSAGFRSRRARSIGRATAPIRATFVHSTVPMSQTSRASSFRATDGSLHRSRMRSSPTAALPRSFRSTSSRTPVRSTRRRSMFRLQRWSMRR